MRPSWRKTLRRIERHGGLPARCLFTRPRSSQMHRHVRSLFEGGYLMYGYNQDAYVPTGKTPAG